MKKGGVRWRHKLWTLEYHNGDKIIDFQDLRRFGRSFVIFRMPMGTARMEAKLDYGFVHHVWPSTLDRWSDGRAVTEQEREELLSALSDWAAQERAHLNVLRGHDTGEYDWH